MKKKCSYIIKILLIFILHVNIVYSHSKLKKNEDVPFRRICYYANWAPYRKIEPILYPDNIDPTICTHIHYAFAKIDPETLALVSTEEHDMNWTEKSQIPLYIRLYGLKRRNNQLKTLLAVGGWSAKSSGFNEATRNRTNRLKFINQTLKFLREWNFDGIDLDWEFPGNIERGADKDSKIHFNLLVSEFRDFIDNEDVSGKKKLILSSAVAADPRVIEKAYDIINLCKNLDYVSIMAYDYHGGSWDVETGLNSPLYGRDGKNYTNSWKNINYTINYWINNGCDSSKINLGLAAYGRSFTLKNSSVNKVGSPTLGKGGEPGVYTKEEGIMSYFEICENILSKNWSRHWDDVQQSVFTTLGDQWIGYDNPRTIILKVKWAISMSLGGTMLWTLDFDDYNGNFCHEGSFPIANTIKTTYDGYSVQSTIILNNTEYITLDEQNLNISNKTYDNYILLNNTSVIKSNSTDIFSFKNISDEKNIDQNLVINEFNLLTTKTSYYLPTIKIVTNQGNIKIVSKILFIQLFLNFFIEFNM